MHGALFRLLKAHPIVQQGCFFSSYSFANPMSKYEQICCFMLIYTKWEYWSLTSKASRGCIHKVRLVLSRVRTSYSSFRAISYNMTVIRFPSFESIIYSPNVWPGLAASHILLVCCHCVLKAALLLKGLASYKVWHQLGWCATIAFDIITVGVLPYRTSPNSLWNRPMCL